MPLHLEEFGREQLQGYVESVPSKRAFKLARFMPKDEVFDTEFAYNIINGQYGQMASITAWDAGAPLRDKEVLERMTGELAKVQHSYRLTEKELLMFNRPRMDAEKKKAVEAVYNSTDNLVFGVQDREEWYRAKAVYEGVLNYAEGDVSVNVDFGIPAENKLTVTTAWSDHANSTPLKDLQTAVSQFKSKNNGEAPEVMQFDSAVEADLLQNASIKTQIFGQNDTRIVTSEQLQNVLSALSLPPYEVVSDSVRGDSGIEALMPAGRVVMIGADLGKILVGPTVEKNYEPGIYAIPQITETNPPRQEVFVGETVFPALERPGAIVHLDV